MAKKKKLTPKQKKFADYLLEHPKEPATNAAEYAYDTKNRNVAALIAHENLQKPVVQAYLDIHSEEASETILDVMKNAREFAKAGDRDGAAYATVAVNAAKDVLDRIHGKATQKTEVTSKSVNINIDLTGTTK